MPFIKGTGFLNVDNLLELYPLIDLDYTDDNQSLLDFLATYPNLDLDDSDDITVVNLQTEIESLYPHLDTDYRDDYYFNPDPHFNTVTVSGLSTMLGQLTVSGVLVDYLGASAEVYTALTPNNIWSTTISGVNVYGTTLSGVNSYASERSYATVMEVTAPSSG